MDGHLTWQLQDNTLKLRGVLDYSSAMDIWRRQNEIISGAGVVVDLAAIEQIDTVGLATLLLLLDAAMKRQVSCQLVGLSERTKALIEAYNLVSLIEPYLRSSANK